MLTMKVIAGLYGAPLYSFLAQISRMAEKDLISVTKSCTTFHFVLENLLISASRSATTVPDDLLGQGATVGILERGHQGLDGLKHDVVADNIQPRVLVRNMIDIPSAAYNNDQKT